MMDDYCILLLLLFVKLAVHLTVGSVQFPAGLLIVFFQLVLKLFA